MRKTGEAYAAARARLASAVTAPLKTGGEGMYPFERFTERAKRVLTHAQEEAERAGHNHIGTEHLLLGLLREPDGLAARVLNNLGVEIKTVRKTLASVLGRSERLIVQRIVPTARVKKVIEASFEEAQRMGVNYVGTEHLLLGLLIEGEGIAAHVLVDLGAALGPVRAQLEMILVEGRFEESAGQGATGRFPRGTGAPMLGPEAGMVINLATILAATRRAQSVGAEHLRYVLEDAGARDLLEMRNRIAAVASQREKAVARADFPEASRLGDEEAKLRKAYERAKAAWQKGLGRRKKPKPPDVS
jgi:ATP-dependent Clp protease ATP-binding subunit ClpA